MKRTERQHLKEHELEALARQAREMVGARRRETTLIVTVLVIVGAILGGYLLWRERVSSKAHDLLAQAVAVHDARVGPPPAPGQPAGGLYYPSTDAGIYARYQEAATWMALDNPAQAAAAYQQVVDKAGNGIYGQTARLGLAEAQARAGQYDQAINMFKELAQRKDGPLPIDGILMRLGRTYLDAGKRSDAQQTFNRLVQEYPESPFNGDAKKELENLRKTT